MLTSLHALCAHVAQLSFALPFNRFSANRCQKFFFPKLKDADIVHTLQWIANKEGVEIHKDALKLIKSRSDGSLRDVEMTLEQLNLLGQRISVPLVQELVGLISDEKLVDLLDLALSADTVNTVKNLRMIMEAGVEPLALMSQLATVITEILAGTYDFEKERRRRKFFRRQPLSKQDMEKLRQALKTLSEVDKQLRVSNDKRTRLTAALLQLAPDQQYVLPTSSDNSFNHSPMTLKNGKKLLGSLAMLKFLTKPAECQWMLEEIIFMLGVQQMVSQRVLVQRKEDLSCLVLLLNILVHMPPIRLGQMKGRLRVKTVKKLKRYG